LQLVNGNVKLAYFLADRATVLTAHAAPQVEPPTP
jgi:hypothetical protein